MTIDNNEIERCMDTLVEKLKRDNECLNQQISAFEAWQPNSWDSHLQIETQKKIIKEMTEIIKTAVMWLRSNELFIKSIQLQTMLQEVGKNNINPFHFAMQEETE